MIKPQTAGERMMERLRAAPRGSFWRDFNPKDWEFGRYGRILNEFRGGAKLADIKKRYKIDDQLARMMRAIAAGRFKEFEMRMAETEDGEGAQGGRGKN